MGCDIHTSVEVKKDGVWRLIKGLHPFSSRQYLKFGFLTGGTVRSGVIGLDILPRGIPADSPQKLDKTVEDDDYHSASWLTVAELLDFDYSATCSEPIYTSNGTRWCPAGTEWHSVTYGNWRVTLGPSFFKDLEQLKTLGDPENVRVVFYFDS